MAVGSRTGNLSGVLGHDGRNAVLFAESMENPQLLPIPEPFPAAAEGELRVVSANLLNYFNGDGRGGGFPAERGARSLEEFQQQQERTAAAMTQLRPDLLAVQELENDGYGPHSAATSLLQLLENSTGEDYAVVEAPGGYLGNDVIAVGAIRGALALGLGVPRDVSIVGFDDIDLATVVDPPLTTVRVPHRRMGRAAAELLLAVDREGIAGTSVAIETSIVERASLGPPRTAPVRIAAHG